MYKLNFTNTTNRYSEKVLFDNIQDVWDKTGKQPTVKNIQTGKHRICFTTYYNRFGSWKNAIIEFVKFKNNGEIIEEISINKQNNRKNLTNSVRYNIMKRDNFRCVICGDSPAISNTTLEIDHIIPITKGGTNDDCNLRTLCKKCNSGKSDKY